ncbi:MAG: hypothetical protein P8P74_00870 [Crocinitomicaceae bacterium]|nr:hypothetical protein [Crocinitomicaceae bacterium]
MRSFQTSFFLIVFVIMSSCSFAQYKFDVGLKTSTYDMERFQFDSRFHFKSPFSIIVSFAAGSQIRSNSSRIPIYTDSLINYTSSYSRKKNYSLKAGVQRKLGFLETEVFYVGATLGAGYLEHFGRFSSETYIIDSVPAYPNYTIYTSEISSTESYYSNRTLSAELAVSFGMDVPITKRISINAELGLVTAYRRSLTYSGSFFDQHLSVLGGLRYSFGKREV